MIQPDTRSLSVEEYSDFRIRSNRLILMKLVSPRFSSYEAVQDLTARLPINSDVSIVEISGKSLELQNDRLLLSNYVAQKNSLSSYYGSTLELEEKLVVDLGEYLRASRVRTAWLDPFNQ